MCEPSGNAVRDAACDPILFEPIRNNVCDIVCEPIRNAVCEAVCEPMGNAVCDHVCELIINFVCGTVCESIKNAVCGTVCELIGTMCVVLCVRVIQPERISTESAKTKLPYMY